MTYHNRIMNLQLQEKKPEPEVTWRMGYSVGHRDARLAAAKIAQGADNTIEDLLDALEFALQQTGCDGDLCTEDWHEEARKAIAKAKGEK